MTKKRRINDVRDSLQSKGKIWKEEYTDRCGKIGCAEDARSYTDPELWTKSSYVCTYYDRISAYDDQWLARYKFISWGMARPPGLVAPMMRKKQ